jgi:cell division protein FtsB
VKIHLWYNRDNFGTIYTANAKIKMPDILKKLFDTRNAVFVLFVIIAFSLVYNTLKVIQRNYELQQQVDKLAAEVALIEIQNQNLKYNIEYYKTDAYLEVEAKRRFNLAESGEKVVLLPKDGDEEPEKFSSSGIEITTSKPKAKYQENLDSWLTFIFGSNGS